MLSHAELINYYDASIRAMKKLRDLEERAQQIRQDKYEIRKRRFWFILASMILLMTILILEFSGFSNGKEIRHSIVSIMVVALAVLQMFKYVNIRVSNLDIRRIKTAYKNCVIEIDQLCSNPPVELKNALMMFEDTRDIEYIQELRKVVFKALASTHSEAAKEVRRQTERMQDMEQRRKLIEAINRNTDARDTDFSKRIAKIVGLSSGGITILEWLTKLFRK